jgi:hypothetical protein
MHLANLSDRLYAISEQIGGDTFHGQCLDNCAKQASSLEKDIEDFAKMVEEVNAMETWNADTLADFVQQTNKYIVKFSRNVHIKYEENT